MNYSNMIEEKNLKKGFIIATLCSTIIGTFTASMGLYDKVQEKKKNGKDAAQDEEIKKLKGQIEQSEKRRRRDKERLALEAGKNRGRDEVSEALARSGALINREFQHGYDQLGQKFAVGDMITENKLQAQVITMQQTVIGVLQDALHHGRQLDRQDLAKLVAASDAAREGSIGALRQQRQRLLVAAPAPQPSPHQHPQLQHAQPPPQFYQPQRQLPQKPPSRASSVVEDDPLYCRYSLSLQYGQNRPLTPNFSARGDCCCPGCGVEIDVEVDDMWAIEKRGSRRTSPDGHRREPGGDVEFLVNARFVVKCHTEDGEFACVLCSRHRDRDFICPTIDALLHHVGQAHSVAELRREHDLKARPV